MTPPHEAELFSARVSVGSGDCGQCDTMDVPVVRFASGSDRFESLVCADCLRAAVATLKHHVTEGKRRKT